MPIASVATLKPYRQAKRDFVREYLTLALRSYGGCHTRTAEAIGLSRMQLIALIREHRIRVPRTVGRRPRGSVKGT